MKGQMFLIIGIFVLLALILLKTETSQSGKGALYASADWKSSLDNVGGEYQKTADISLYHGGAQSLENNLNNFSNFSLDSFNKRGYSLRIFYSLAFANSTNITAVVGNFQGSVKNISLNMSAGQSIFIPSLEDRQSNSTVFPAGGGFGITVSYYLNETAKNFTYYSDNNVTAAFYAAVRLQQADSFAEDILLFNKTAS